MCLHRLFTVRNRVKNRVLHWFHLYQMSNSAFSTCLTIACVTTVHISHPLYISIFFCVSHRAEKFSLFDLTGFHLSKQSWNVINNNSNERISVYLLQINCIRCVNCIFSKVREIDSSFRKSQRQRSMVDNNVKSEQIQIDKWKIVKKTVQKAQMPMRIS